MISLQSKGLSRVFSSMTIRNEHMSQLTPVVCPIAVIYSAFHSQAHPGLDNKLCCHPDSPCLKAHFDKNKLLRFITFFIFFSLVILLGSYYSLEIFCIIVTLLILQT